MAKRPFLEFILHVINFTLVVCSLSTIGYGLVCFFMWKQNPSKEIDESNVSDQVPWFIYLLIGGGAFLFIISCFGFIGTTLRSPCCLFFYSMLFIVLIIVEIGVAAFIFFKPNWNEVIAKDQSGTFQSIYHFLDEYWEINRWFVLAAFILQVIAVIIALYLQSVFNNVWHDKSDDESMPQKKSDDKSMPPKKSDDVSMQQKKSDDDSMQQKKSDDEDRGVEPSPLTTTTSFNRKETSETTK